MTIQKIFSSLGTVNTITAECGEQETEKTNAVLDQAERYIRTLDDALSVFKPASEISRLNKAAGKEAVPVGKDTYEIIRLSEQYKRLTGGAFNAAAKPLTELCKSTPTPDRKAVRAALKLTNGEIVMDEKGSSVLLKRKGQALDFGGIAKGYAMDQLIRLFEENGVKNVLINLGGTVCSVGKERSIGIRDPFTPANRNAPQRIVASISSQDEIFVTSGTYEQGLHIVDPVKGRLAQTELLAVTVIGRNGALLDAAATACMVLGLKKSVNLLQKNRLDGVFILTDGSILATDKIQNRLERKG